MSSTTSITWRGVTFYGTSGAGRYTFATLEGWEDLPDARQEEYDRPSQHGMFDADVYSGARRVLASGRCSSPAERDVMLAELKAAFSLTPTTTLPLVIDHAGKVLTVGARLLRFKPTSPAWGSGFWGWAAEWICPDPLRYAAPVVTWTPFAQMLGGLEFDLFTDGVVDTGFLEFGDPGAITGLVAVSNSGSAQAWPVFTVAGPTPPEGFDLVDSVTGSRLRYTGVIPSSSTLTIDSATGLVTLDGVDRKPYLTIREWFSIAPDSSASILFSPRGGPTSAVLTVTVTPPSW